MKYFFMVLTALILIGCGKAEVKPEVIAYPSWYLNPPQNTQHALYGVGEGSDINVAKASALSFVSESLSLTVSSELKKRETSRSYNGEETTDSSIVSNLKAQAKAMEFSEYRIIRNQQIGSKIVLLVEVSREKLFHDQKVKLERFVKELKAEEKSIAKHPLLTQALLHKKRSGKQYTLKSLALLAKTIKPGFDPSGYIKQSAQIADAAQDALNRVKISIHASKQAAIFADAIKEGLHNAGMQTSQKNTNTQVSLNGSFQFDEIYGFKITKATLLLSSSQKRKTIASNTLTLSGRSKYDFEKAKAGAAEMLREKIRQEGIFSVLGIR